MDSMERKKRGMAEEENEWGVFFWKPPAFLSNWTVSPFIFLGQKYVQAEQAIMHRKALLFQDMTTAEKIMATEKPEKQKALGRSIKGLIYTKWCKHRPILLMHILYAKFSQNQEFKLALLATGSKQIFESSPYDLIWGTGVSPRDSVQCQPSDAEQWPGENILGKTLMKVRDVLSGRVPYDPSTANFYNTTLLSLKSKSELPCASTSNATPTSTYPASTPRHVITHYVKPDSSASNSISTSKCPASTSTHVETHYSKPVSSVSNSKSPCTYFVSTPAHVKTHYIKPDSSTSNSISTYIYPASTSTRVETHFVKPVSTTSNVDEFFASTCTHVKSRSSRRSSNCSSSNVSQRWVRLQPQQTPHPLPATSSSLHDQCSPSVDSNEFVNTCNPKKPQGRNRRHRSCRIEYGVTVI